MKSVYNVNTSPRDVPISLQGFSNVGSFVLGWPECKKLLDIECATITRPRCRERHRFCLQRRTPQTRGRRSSKGSHRHDEVGVRLQEAGLVVPHVIMNEEASEDDTLHGAGLSLVVAEVSRVLDEGGGIEVVGVEAANPRNELRS